MEKQHKENGRRDFLKKFGLLGAALPLVGSQQLMAASHSADETALLPAEGKVILNVLQTTDVHCQIHPHDELFGKTASSISSNRGYAQLASYLKAERAAHPILFWSIPVICFKGVSCR